MFQLRHSFLLTLLVSCSVYDASLLNDAQPGQNGAAAGGSNRGNSSDGSSGRASTAGQAAGVEPVAGEASAMLPASSGSSNAGGGTSPISSGNGSGASAGVEASGGHAGVSAGGGAGSGGSPSIPGLDLLDDMEDGNFYLSPKPPRYGYWYVAGDATLGAKLSKIDELIAPLVPARGASTSAVHFVANGFKGWGASVGLTFADATQKRVSYDAGDALGISFWVRGSVANGSKLRVLFPTSGTDPTGKSCGGTGQGQCLDHFSAQVSVTAEWQQVSVPFSALHQAGWGAPLPAFEVGQMLGIEWTGGVSNVDLWLDDLALMRPQ